MLPISAQDIVDVAGFRVRVPDIRTRGAAKRDLTAECIKVEDNDALKAVLGAADLSPDNAKVVKLFIDGSDKADWGKVWDIAMSVPESAAILAGWAYFQDMKRAHLVRHHLLLDGQKNPLPLSALNGISDADLTLIADKIIELMTVDTRP